MFLKIVSDVITVRYSYLVKSVNLAFTHALFRDVTVNRLNRPELLAPFLNAGRDYSHPNDLVSDWINLVWLKRSHCRADTYAGRVACCPPAESW